MTWGAGMFRCRHAPPTATHGRAARWFWRLMLLGPSFFLLASSVILYEMWVFHGGDVKLPSKGEGWMLSSPLVLQFYFGLIAVLSCFAIAGVNATSLWFAWSARFVGLWSSVPALLNISEDFVGCALGCTSYQTGLIATWCQSREDLYLLVPYTWPFVSSWPLT